MWWTRIPLRRQIRKRVLVMEWLVTEQLRLLRLTPKFPSSPCEPTLTSIALTTVGAHPALLRTIQFVLFYAKYPSYRFEWGLRLKAQG